MIAREMHNSFLIELNDTDLPSIASFDVYYWLNRATEKFIKTRYTGNNPKGDALEQTQKRIDDLRTLVTKEDILIRLEISSITAANPVVLHATDVSNLVNGDTVYIYDSNINSSLNGNTYTVGSVSTIANTFTLVGVNGSGFAAMTTNGYVYIIGNDTNSYLANLPSDYMFSMSEEVLISYILSGSRITKKQGVTETTKDTYRRLVDDPYGQHILHYYEAQPLRLYEGDSIEFITDGNYYIDNLYLSYIKQPSVINGDSSPTVDCDLPEHTHAEIVKLAISMYLESKKDPSYQTKMVEIQTME